MRYNSKLTPGSEEGWRGWIPAFAGTTEREAEYEVFGRIWYETLKC